MEALKLIWMSVSLASNIIWILYIVNRVVKQFNPVLGQINKEMWWTFCYVAAPITNVGFYTNGVEWWDYIFGPINLWIWYDAWKNDDHDDRWKKRRKKALSKVKQIAGKLVVVPQPEPA